MNRMTVDTFVKYDRHTRDAFWFATDDKVVTVAKVTDTKTGKVATIKAIGNVQIQFDGETTWYNGLNAVSEARQRGITTDKMLTDKSNNITGENNWFDIEISGQIDYEHDVDYCLTDIDEAIQKAKKILKEVA